MTPPGRIDRRTFLAASAAVGGLGALAGACGTGSGGGSSAVGHGNGVGSGRPKRGGQLVFANEAEDNSFDPAVGQWDESGINYARAVYDPLAIIAADGTVKPYLAESITPNADYTAWTIRARPGVRFHDGTACDGPAIAGSMNHFLSGSLGTVLRGPIESVTATDPATVVVSLSQPWVPFDYYLTGGVGGQIAYVVAPAYVAAAEKAQNGGAPATPVGTGPFRYADWVPNDHFTAVRNPAYWRPGLPYLDQVTYKPITDDSQRADSLNAGTVDMLHTSASPYILQFRDDPSVGYVDDLHQTLGEPDMACLLLNLSQPPFDDLRARQALAHALDVETYKRVIAKGLNPVADQPFGPGSPYHAAVDYPRYDPTTARSLVTQYQRDHGQPLRFTLGTTPSPLAAQANQFMQQNFEAVGMQVSITEVQQDQYIANALAGKFQALAWRQFGAVDPDLNYVFWSPTTIYPSLGLAVNMARNTDAAVQTALEQGRTSLNPAVRAKAYQQVAARFAVDLPYIWTDRAVWAVVARPRVQNFNNPSTPAGGRGYGMIAGTFFPTEVWVDA